MTIIVQHKVRDFETWKSVFDQSADVSRSHSATGHEVYRSPDDPNEVTVVTHFSSGEQAKAFAESPSLREAMERAGVVGKPVITWLEEVERVTY
jgi:heme-degrading monooxygenase HmoA